MVDKFNLQEIVTRMNQGEVRSTEWTAGEASQRLRSIHKKIHSLKYRLQTAYLKKKREEIL